MYTHIPTAEALDKIHEVPDHVIEALDLIMNNNIFQFSNTFWKQLSGTAMGTPPACMWAMLFFNRHEQSLCTTYNRWLLDWAHYIDNGIGIWDCDAGDASGQGLIAGSIIGQGQLTRQAESSVVPPVHQVSWMDPIDDGRMVRGSIAWWNGARLRAGLRRQQAQGCRQGAVPQIGTQVTHSGPMCHNG